VTNDNASNNETTAEEVEMRLIRRGLGMDWHAEKRKLGCLDNVIQLGIEGFMGKITKKSALETSQAIWKYNP
ncbi:hypothetical protein C8Q76DRAFT_585885, partial [Earliella scabrosa]